MNRFPLRAGAAATLLVLAGTAQAQSSVTIGGIADAAVRHVDNAGVGSVSSLASGGNSTSRLIVRGTEDLGGGLSAGFHLEHGISLDTGAQVSSTLFWDRRATLSLASKSLGELRAGRDLVPSYVNWSRYDPFSYVGVAGSTTLISNSPQGPIRAAFSNNPNPNTVVRASNALQWLMPAGWGGLEGGVMVAAGEGGTSANGQHKVIGLRLGYATSRFGVSAAQTTTESDRTTAGKFKDRALGGHVDLGVAKLSAAWRRFSYDRAEQTNTMLGLWVPVGASGELKASWLKADLSGRVGATVIDDNDATQWALGYVHSLSKRTALYGTWARIANDGALTLAVPGGASGMAAGGTSRGLELGVRHSF